MNSSRRHNEAKPHKPVSINIYYNINSKNVTNSHNHHGIQTAPISARVGQTESRNPLNPKQIAQHLQKNKNKSNKLKKKKYSMDLTAINDRKIETKNNRKSFNNSVSSGTGIQSYRKKNNEKSQRNQRLAQKRDNITQQKQKKISKLLESYSGGQIQKKQITKKILGIFQGSDKNRSMHQQRKIGKKKQSQSTLIGTATPRNLQIIRANNMHNPQSRYLNKTRKKHSRSQKCSFTHSKTIINKDYIGDKVIQIKGIDSSLFLTDKQQQRKVVVDRLDQIHTSNSVMDLNRIMRQQRKSLPKQLKINPYRQMMAIRIQRAWRRYKTNNIIKHMVQECKSQDMDDSIIKGVNSSNIKNQGTEKQHDFGVLMSDINISPKISKSSQNSLSQGLEQLSNFLSQQMPQMHQLKNTQKMKGQILRNYEISKWNQIMDYVYFNINDKQLAPKQCLQRIITYFQHIKSSVQRQLTIGGISTRAQNKSTQNESSQKKYIGDKFSKLQQIIRKKKYLLQEQQHAVEQYKIMNNGSFNASFNRRSSPQITQFTNKNSMKQIQSDQYFSGSGFKKCKQFQSDDNLKQPILSETKMFKLAKEHLPQENIDSNCMLKEYQKQQEFNDHQNISDDLKQFAEHQSSSSSDLYYTSFAKIAQVSKIQNEDEIDIQNNEGLLSSATPSLDRIQYSLIKHYNRIQKQHEQQLYSLDIHSPTYFTTKKQINKKYHQMKSQLKKIIKNFNKGYQQAKNILDQQLQGGQVKPNNKQHQSSLSECGSHGSLSKCKSDNYLLKTAINYKKYMEKKQQLQENQSESQYSIRMMRYSADTGLMKNIDKKMTEQFQQNVSYEQIEDMKVVHKNIAQKQKQKNQDINRNNIQHMQCQATGKSEYSFHESDLLDIQGPQQNQNSLVLIQGLQNSGETSKTSNCQPVQINKNQQQKLCEQAVSSMQMIQDIQIAGKLYQESNGSAFNTMLDQGNIMSAQLLQYEELDKNFDDQDQQQQKSKLQKSEQISLFENNKLNKNIRKLQSLTAQDKEDIFEFLFIDLTLEIITEYDQDTKIHNALLKQIQRRKLIMNIPRGVKTSLNSSKQYMSGLLHDIKENYWKTYIKHIGTPMGPSAKQMLRYMHDQQHDSDSQSDIQNQSVSLILPISIFQQHQVNLPKNYPKFYDNQEKQASRIKFLKSVQHIHHKAIFDCINQWLDTERPYGLWGAPFPWKTSPKNAQNANISEQKKLQKLKYVMGKATECCSYLCGVLVDKQQSVFGTYKVSQHYVQQIRQDRMCKMLSNQLYQNQDRWHFFDDEETEVIIEISKVINRLLIQQATLAIAQIIKI